MTNFASLSENFLKTLQDLKDTSVEMNGILMVLSEHIETYKLDDGSFTLVASGRDLKINRTLSAHQRLKLEQKICAFAKSFYEFENPLLGIKGLCTSFNMFHLRANLNKNIDNTGETFCIESASVCASGQTRDYTELTLEEQVNWVAHKAQEALTGSQDWDTRTLHSWGVIDLPDHRGQGGLVREIIAPTYQDALLADGWNNWLTDVSPETKCSVTKGINGPIVFSS